VDARVCGHDGEAVVRVGGGPRFCGDKVFAGMAEGLGCSQPSSLPGLGAKRTEARRPRRGESGKASSM